MVDGCLPVPTTRQAYMNNGDADPVEVHNRVTAVGIRATLRIHPLHNQDSNV